LICELEIGNYVKWGGWIPNIELAYNNAHLLLHTALDEACPLVLIEAQLAGLPLVSTTLGGSQDIVGSHYGAISGKNPEEYCNRIVEIAGDYDSFLFRSVQDIGVAIERFSTEKMASFYTTSFDHF
jgi:glycosyltransferase involved in cell wall biosynthesis